MLAEIYLIQRFVCYLTDPVYANTIVITVLLVASGFGSLLSSRLPIRSRAAVVLAVGGITAFCAFFLLGLSPLLRATLELPLAERALVATLIIAPFGMCLGIPFPTGLSTLAEGEGAMVPWAWGVNGALSVTGAVLARVVSTSAGLSDVVVAVIGLYLIAGALFLRGIGVQAKTSELLRGAWHSS